MREISAKLSKNAEVKASDVTVTDAGGRKLNVKDVKSDGTTVTVTLDQDLDIRGKYALEITDLGSADAVAGSVVRTDEFDRKYAYNGDDFGATYDKNGTVFKLWAPTAQKVELVTFRSADSADAEEAAVVEIRLGEKGVWNATEKVPSSTAYIYRVSFADGTTNDSADPYARASVVNGRRSVVLSNAVTTVKDSRRMAPFTKNTDAVIAETHIRDLTKNANSGVSEAHRGKYLGMIENGTKNSKGKATGADYLKELGVTHVQIQPNAYELDTRNSTVSFFNDSIRDGLKGSVFSTEDTDFASGKPNTEGLILNNMLGCQNLEGISKGSFCTNGNANVKYGNAGQIVNYVEIHDNLTLSDKLNVSLFGKKTDDELDAAQKTEKIKVSKLADSAVFLAYGVSEFQVGQEMLRTKGGDENSYNAGDDTNKLDWDRLNDAEYADNAQYMRDLIKIRKCNAVLRVGAYDTINKNAKVLKSADGLVAYEVKDGNGANYVVVLNHNDQPTDLNGVTAGKYGVLVSNGKTYLHPAVSDTTAAAADAAPADTGKDVSKAGSTVQIADGDAIAVPAKSALLLGPTAAMTEPDDNPTNPNYPDNPDNSDHSDQLDKPSGNNAHDGANNAANGANNSSAPNGGTASTGSSIAVIIAMVIVLLIAGSGMLIRAHSSSE